MTKNVLITLIIGGLGLTACKNENSTLNVDFTALGDSIAQQTFDTLSYTLKEKISAGGFENAVSFCQLKAIDLTQTFSDDHTSIKRTSLKVRNRNNQADELEKSQIQHFQDLIDSGAVLKSKLVAEHTGVVHFFKPIIMQPLCLNCHGDPKKDISPATLAILEQKYPADEATGYTNGELRGVWHITFEPFATKNNKK
jgi:hypothetical protein